MTRPRLVRSIPFWGLIVGSLASIAGGVVLLTDKLGTMTTTLTDGTATGVEVYVGQVWAILGTILVGAGLIGLALAATVGALRAFAPAEPAEVVEAPAWVEEPEVEATEAAAEPEAEPAEAEAAAAPEPEVEATEAAVEPEPAASR